MLRSRRDRNLAPSFPEVRSGHGPAADATALDGELVVRESSRLAFERLRGRLQRRGAGAGRLAEQWPAHFVAFDLLRLAGTDTTRCGRTRAPGRLLRNAFLPDRTSPRRGRCARRSLR
ncbi:ATP-dependent DNA ligase [Streptomyces olivaceoviridis]|uniref:ATP-dependent DNA ligase n=1 Tax=Streptomyces olivaceoviridis TaxID=1921 RepID=UPI0037AA9DD4